MASRTNKLQLQENRITRCKWKVLYIASLEIRAWNPTTYMHTSSNSFSKIRGFPDLCPEWEASAFYKDMLNIPINNNFSFCLCKPPPEGEHFFTSSSLSFICPRSHNSMHVKMHQNFSLAIEMSNLHSYSSTFGPSFAYNMADLLQI